MLVIFFISGQPFLIGQSAIIWPGALQAKQVIEIGWRLDTLVEIIGGASIGANIISRARILSAELEAWIKFLDKNRNGFFTALAARDLAIRLFSILIPAVSSVSLIRS